MFTTLEFQKQYLDLNPWDQGAGLEGYHPLEFARLRKIIY